MAKPENPKTANEFIRWIDYEVYEREQKHEEMGSHPQYDIRTRVTRMALERALALPPDPLVAIRRRVTRMLKERQKEV